MHEVVISGFVGFMAFAGSMMFFAVRDLCRMLTR